MTVNAVPYVEQALSHPADNFRRALSFVGQGQQGVRSWISSGGTGNSELFVAQNGSPNMSVNVNAGQALIAGTQNTTSQGSYHLLNDATVNLAIAAADPTNPRIDIVCASIQDAAYSGGSNQALLQVVTGTPAPSPSPPATPANSIVLANVAVAALATSIVNANITDKRPTFGSLFHAEIYQTTLQSVPNGGNTQIAFDTTEADPNGNITLGASAHYTCPVPGRYLVASTTTYVNPIQLAHMLWKNGVEARRLQQFGTGVAQAPNGSAVIRANGTDTLDIRDSQSSGSAQNTFPGQPYVFVQFSYLGPF